MPTEARNDFEFAQYTSSDAVSPIAVNPGRTPAKPDPPLASQPLVAGGLKDSHDTTPKLQLVLRASDALEDGPGRYPILDPYTEKRVGFPWTTCAPAACYTRAWCAWCAARSASAGCVLRRRERPLETHAEDVAGRSRQFDPSLFQQPFHLTADQDQRRKGTKIGPVRGRPAVPKIIRFWPISTSQGADIDFDRGMVARAVPTLVADC
jgi:hypothetical protein